jgi:hypothetical protein
VNKVFRYLPIEILVMFFVLQIANQSGMLLLKEKAGSPGKVTRFYQFFDFIQSNRSKFSPTAF